MFVSSNLPLQRSDVKQGYMNSFLRISFNYEEFYTKLPVNKTNQFQNTLIFPQETDLYKPFVWDYSRYFNLE